MLRILKRAIAREIFKTLTRDLAFRTRRPTTDPRGQEHHHHRRSQGPGHLPHQDLPNRTRHLPRLRAHRALQSLAQRRLTPIGASSGFDEVWRVLDRRSLVPRQVPLAPSEAVQAFRCSSYGIGTPVRGIGGDGSCGLRRLGAPSAPDAGARPRTRSRGRTRAPTWSPTATGARRWPSRSTHRRTRCGRGSSSWAGTAGGGTPGTTSTTPAIRARASPPRVAGPRPRRPREVPDPPPRHRGRLAGRGARTESVPGAARIQ